ncbi:MAG: hypothetical protein AAFY56_04545 [Pseudomonadota bacterium]
MANETNPSNQAGDYVNQVVNWFKTRNQNDWIIFGLGVVVGLIIA